MCALVYPCRRGGPARGIPRPGTGLCRYGGIGRKPSERRARGPSAMVAQRVEPHRRVARARAASSIAASASCRPRPSPRNVGPDVQPFHFAHARLQRPRPRRTRPSASPHATRSSRLRRAARRSPGRPASSSAKPWKPRSTPSDRCVLLEQRPDLVERPARRGPARSTTVTALGRQRCEPARSSPAIAARRRSAPSTIRGPGRDV